MGNNQNGVNNAQHNRQGQNNQVVNNPQAKNYEELTRNNMAIVPSAVMYDVKSNDIERALLNCLQSLNVSGLNERVYVVSKYNPHFNSVLSGKYRGKDVIYPFNTHIVVQLDKDDRKRMGGKGKRSFSGRGNNGLSNLLGTLNSIARNNTDKAQFQLLGDEGLDTAIANFTSGSVDWHLSKDRTVASIKLDMEIVLRWLFDIPTERGGFVLDFVSANDHRNKGFTVKVLKSIANKNFKRNDFDPMKYVR